jgi:cobalt-precorrin 5A hydrolase
VRHGEAPIVAIAVTRTGASLARRLRDLMPGVSAIIPVRFAQPVDERSALTAAYDGSARGVVTTAFRESPALVLVMAAGIAVRLVAPLLGDKRSDPAVVVVDDAGRFAISLLSGHLGGANRLTERVAAALGATPVITTASEAVGVPSPELIGEEWGWRIEQPSALTRAAAALVNGESVGVVQECGLAGWLPKPLPPHVTLYTSLGALRMAAPAAALVVSDRTPLLELEGLPAVVYRPPTLVLGVGASKGAPAAELQQLAEETVAAGGFSLLSVAAVATIDLKRHEPALVMLAGRLGVPLLTYPAAELDDTVGEWTPSEIVRRAVATGGVCEPAALRAAGVPALAVPKRKSAHATAAIARVPAGLSQDGVTGESS